MKVEQREDWVILPSKEVMKICDRDFPVYAASI